MEDLIFGWEVMLVGSKEGIHSKDAVFVINVSEISERPGNSGATPVLSVLSAPGWFSVQLPL